MEQLQTMWSSRQSEFMELEEQIEPELNVQNDYYERLESLSEWIDTVEDLVDSTKNADNYELFKEAEECFQVIFSSPSNLANEFIQSIVYFLSNYLLLRFLFVFMQSIYLLFY